MRQLPTAAPCFFILSCLLATHIRRKNHVPQREEAPNAARPLEAGSLLAPGRWMIGTRRAHRRPQEGTVVLRCRKPWLCAMLFGSIWPKRGTKYKRFGFRTVRRGCRLKMCEVQATLVRASCGAFAHWGFEVEDHFHKSCHTTCRSSWFPGVSRKP